MGIMIEIWTIFLITALSALFLYLGLATLYLLVLAVAYFVCKNQPAGSDEPQNRFAILVPAHNEAQLIGTLCTSLLEIDYPKSKTGIYVIADNCTDETAEICREHQVTALEREDRDNAGKGQAIAWALKQIQLTDFDAVFVVDADSYVDPGILAELNRSINHGEQAIQCYNGVGNRDDSGFTQLLFVSRTINNLLYQEAKYRLGLSAFLTGNGLCFRSDLLQERGWTAFSAGEDWEYYAQLVADDIPVGFAAGAKVYHQESRSLNQATTQRLRWSSSRFSVAKNLGLPLFIQGIRQRRWIKADATAPLLFPNYSLQINLTVGGFILALLLPGSPLKLFFLLGFLLLLMGLSLVFAAGAYIAGSPGKILRAILYVPMFLLWKSVIDILCATGLYKDKKWIRTRRH